MRVIFLCPYDKPDMVVHMTNLGDEVYQTDREIFEPTEGDFIVSYGYRQILKKPVLDKFKDRAINLHISYLPWNRGADPNVWSFIDDTPKGVSIHFIDEGIDTGDIIVQRYMKYDYHNDTLQTFYNKLQECVEDLFIKSWKYIRAGNAKRYPQGTFHKAGDLMTY